MRGPAAMARPAPAPKTPNAAPRALPWNSWPISVGPTAKRIAAPVPWTARAAARVTIPPASPQAREAREKTRNPTAKTRLRPKRSAREPAVSRKAARVRAYASITHWSPEKFACSEARISGRATLTTVRSSISMKVAMVTMATVHHPVAETCACAVGGASTGVDAVGLLMCFGAPAFARGWGPGGIVECFSSAART